MTKDLRSVLSDETLDAAWFAWSKSAAASQPHGGPLSAEADAAGRSAMREVLAAALAPHWPPQATLVREGTDGPIQLTAAQQAEANRRDCAWTAPIALMATGAALHNKAWILYLEASGATFASSTEILTTYAARVGHGSLRGSRISRGGDVSGLLATSRPDRSRKLLASRRPGVLRFSSQGEPQCHTL